MTKAGWNMRSRLEVGSSQAIPADRDSQRDLRR
jgi:hypothetical protein